MMCPSTGQSNTCTYTVLPRIVLDPNPSLVWGLAAKVALHNLCLWLNQQRGRPLLALADLIDW